MSKTPVSILQEYCTRQILVPQYDLVVNGVGTHDPLFRYKLTVQSIVTFGDGKSKKEAKHEAARNALALLPVNANTSSSENHAVQPEISEQVEDITSPYHGALKENAIGELITICTNNKLPAPEYKLTGDEGLPHAKLFTFECHVAKLIETAASRTKKQAKHLSAKLMLKRLKAMLGDKLELNPPDPLDSKDQKTVEIDENAKLAYANLKTTKLNENFDLLISNYHSIDLTPVFGDNPAPIIKLSHYNLNGHNYVNAEDLLEEIFQEAEVAVTFGEMPSLKKDNCLIVCELDSCPSFVVFGMDCDKQMAIRKAAHEMLCLLKSFCHGINQ